MGEPLSVSRDELECPQRRLYVVEDVPAAFADLVVVQVGSWVAGPDRTRDLRFSLVLSGGATARECYRQLALRPGLDWGRGGSGRVPSATAHEICLLP